MRYVPAVCLLILLSAVTATAQILPTSNGSCRVTASGLESCNWMSGVSHDKAHNDTDGPRSQLFVTRWILAPGAPLNPSVEGRDVLIVGMNNGKLANEKKSPQSQVNVSNGLVILMPKEEPYLLRNAGKEKLELLVIEVGK
jgi:mannose-6-phosphate isomerase-like protein (cupin superfamily)